MKKIRTAATLFVTLLIVSGSLSFAFAADAVMLLVSLPLCYRLDKTARKMFPEEVKG